MVEHLQNGWPFAVWQGYNGCGWYFWDETETYCHGPYVAEIIAVKALELYVKRLNERQPDNEFAN